MCSQFLVFDLDTMEYVVVSVPPRQEDQDRVSLTAIRAIAKQGVRAVITGDIKDICRHTLLDLGIDVIDGVEGMTVQEAIERYKVTGLQAVEERKGLISRIAVVSQGEGLEAPLDPHFDTCNSFIVVDPTAMTWEMIQVKANGPAHEVNKSIIRAIARSGASVLITPQLHPECCMVLQALAVMVYVAPPGITVSEAIEKYESGELEQAFFSPFAGSE
jgi:predicted Fe-Mo cluster-binding NifX family protein